MNIPLIEMLSCVTDHRRGQAKQYVLANMLLFCIIGFLCGAHSYKALCSFIDERFALLQAAFASRMKRAPALSILWSIVGKVEAEELEAVFRRHAARQHAALGGGAGEIVAHDGQSQKGSYDTANDKRMSQLLRAFAVGTEIILGHIAIMAKSNEIPAMQTLVRELGLPNPVCTTDAMHCQIKIVEAVNAAGGAALLQVKGNQPSLEAAFEALPSQYDPKDCSAETGKIARNRQETRTVEVFQAGRILDLPEWQAYAVEAVRVPVPSCTRTSPPVGNGVGHTKLLGTHRPSKASPPNTTPVRRAAIGVSRTASITCSTSPCKRMPARFEKAQPSALSCAALPSTFSASTRSRTSPTPSGVTL